MAYVQQYVAAGQSGVSLCRSECVGGRIGDFACYIYTYVAMGYFIGCVFVSELMCCSQAENPSKIKLSLSGFCHCKFRCEQK